MIHRIVVKEHLRFCCNVILFKVINKKYLVDFVTACVNNEIPLIVSDLEYDNPRLQCKQR